MDNSLKIKPFFVGSNIFARELFGKMHPLSGKRVSGVIELCKAMGWLKDEDITQSRAASFNTLSRFHDKQYITAIKEADQAGMVSAQIRNKYCLGTMENPLFKGLYQRAATTVGGSILAAQLLKDGGTVYHPSGGTHHGRPDRASGFCYFNDPVFAILEFLDQGLKSVAYVDIDVHFGDGVQDAFEQEQRVHTFSIHEEKRWPYTGGLEDRGGGQSFNMPVPHGLNDTEFDYMLDQAVYPNLKRIKPQAIVITLGADGLYGDPLSKMNLSNGALWRCVMNLRAMSPRTIILGGGGYNPWTTLRCWAGMWGLLIGADLNAELNSEARAVLNALECDLIDEDEMENDWLSRITDEPRTGDIRPSVIEVAAQAK